MTPRAPDRPPSTPSAGKLAGTAKVGEKGQIVIPKEMRDMFGITAGDTLLVLADVDKGIAIVRPETLDEFAATIMDAGASSGDSPGSQRGEPAESPPDHAS